MKVLFLVNKYLIKRDRIFFFTRRTININVFSSFSKGKALNFNNWSHYLLELIFEAKSENIYSKLFTINMHGSTNICMKIYKCILCA